MITHDLMCRYEVDGLGLLEWCTCELIAKVRADERARLHARLDELPRSLDGRVNFAHVLTLLERGQ